MFIRMLASPATQITASPGWATCTPRPPAAQSIVPRTGAADPWRGGLLRYWGRQSVLADIGGDERSSRASLPQADFRTSEGRWRRFSSAHQGLCPVSSSQSSPSQAWCAERAGSHRLRLPTGSRPGADVETIGLGSRNFPTSAASISTVDHLGRGAKTVDPARCAVTKAGTGSGSAGRTRDGEVGVGPLPVMPSNAPRPGDGVRSKEPFAHQGVVTGSSTAFSQPLHTGFVGRQN